MAKATKSKKKPIDQYDHKGKKRVNNPPVEGRIKGARSLCPDELRQYPPLACLRAVRRQVGWSRALRLS